MIVGVLDVIQDGVYFVVVIELKNEIQVFELDLEYYEVFMLDVIVSFVLQNFLNLVLDFSELYQKSCFVFVLFYGES